MTLGELIEELQSLELSKGSDIEVVAANNQLREIEAVYFDSTPNKIILALD